MSEFSDEDLKELGCNELVPRKKLMGHVKQLVRAADAKAASPALLAVLQTFLLDPWSRNSCMAMIGLRAVAQRQAPLLCYGVPPLIRA